MHNAIFTITLLLSSYKIVGCSKQQWKRSTATVISLPLAVKESKSINPLYKPKEDDQHDPQIFYTIPTCAEYISKEEFDTYKKNNSNLIKRITYSQQGLRIVYAWEPSPHFF